MLGRRAEEIWRIGLVFVSSLFEIDRYLKRYVGGLVLTTRTSVYRALRNLGSDYRVSASLFGRLLFL